MKNISIYLIIFIILGSGALFLGRQNNAKKNEGGILNSLTVPDQNQQVYKPVTQNPTEIIQKITPVSPTHKMLESKNPPLDKKLFNGRSTIKKSSFSTTGMNDSQYKEFDKRENELNMKLIDEAFRTAWDKNKDGDVSQKERENFEKEIKKAGHNLEKALKESKEMIQNQEEKANNKNFENACREVRDELYRQYGFENEAGFPDGQRKKMNEYIAKELPHLLDMITNQVRTQSTRQLGL